MEMLSLKYDKSKLIFFLATFWDNWETNETQDGILKQTNWYVMYTCRNPGEISNFQIR